MATAWRKSSFSGGGGEQGGNDCVEVSYVAEDTLVLRDSKAPSRGVIVAIGLLIWVKSR
ncbi:DUF397 domain-containing protein [Actinokineospora enzanensis]|uniref:DUF397 domain-containing protein n=1 Tax=Actinokineospora enzanensis TaxID=155975 RepID=UPI0003A91FEA|nr:DUF397 domain-containing protein [Actinokineospora enzanensis]